jgi:hypothetical protein
MQAQRQTKSVCHCACMVRLSVTTAWKSPRFPWGAFPGLEKKREERGWARVYFLPPIHGLTLFNYKELDRCGPHGRATKDCTTVKTPKGCYGLHDCEKPEGVLRIARL